jgi:hypothetical protein
MDWVEQGRSLKPDWILGGRPVRVVKLGLGGGGGGNLYGKVGRQCDA